MFEPYQAPSRRAEYEAWDNTDHTTMMWQLIDRNDLGELRRDSWRSDPWRCAAPRAHTSLATTPSYSIHEKHDFCRPGPRLPAQRGTCRTTYNRSRMRGRTMASDPPHVITNEHNTS